MYDRWTLFFSSCRRLTVFFCLLFRVTAVPMDAWHVALNHVGRCVDRGALYFCGFPTLQHIRHKVSLAVIQARVCKEGGL